jgi:hypothetical protein
MANKFFRKNLIPAAATETELYVVPAANSSILSSLRVTNAHSANTLIDVVVYPLGGSTAHSLLKNHFLPVNATMDVLSGIPCVLEATDEIHVESSQANVVFYLSYLEVDRN